MTGNVAQVFGTDEDWDQVLRAIGAALGPRGYLVFETRRPGRRAWEEWEAETGPVRRDVPGSGLVERRLEVTAVDLPFVSFRYTYTFLADGAVVTSDSTLRFRGRDEVEASLAARGYRVLEVRDAPDRPGRESCSSPSGRSDGDLDRRVRGRYRAAVGPDLDVVGPPATRPVRTTELVAGVSWA